MTSPFGLGLSGLEGGHPWAAHIHTLPFLDQLSSFLVSFLPLLLLFSPMFKL